MVVIPGDAEKNMKKSQARRTGKTDERDPDAKGDHEAMLSLAFMYENGQGMPRDIKQALVWYRKSARRGNDHAAGCLARLFQDGLAEAKDEQWTLAMAEW